ncbi:hypothetical protein AMECASPLE_021167 [Ameca splendens]|uniref:Peptidase A2 domain-containing protein n=1 Tax=Ameca splendens TaxID=208324 RepID=A0ABV0Z1J0_9TELE
MSVPFSSQTVYVHEINLTEVQNLYLHVAVDKISCTVQILTSSAARPVELTVDSGSSVSILPKFFYEKYFRGEKLQPPKVKLVTYSRAPIPVIGCLPATVLKK